MLDKKLAKLGKIKYLKIDSKNFIKFSILTGFSLFVQPYITFMLSVFYVWPILGQYVWPNYFIGSSHNQEIDFLKGWISHRLNWMDGQINNF